MPSPIRPAAEADVPRLIEVARRSFLSAFGATAPAILIEQWAREDRESTSYPRDWAQMFVVERDGAIAGLMQPTVDEIDGLWIHPDFQGQGIGSLLLEYGEGVIRGRGFARSWLTCSSFNPRALEFYRRRGYTVFRSTRKLHECGVDEASFGMERMLDGTS
jgi:[ribosomal protein S18]-alanine N-acetyltransferase